MQRGTKKKEELNEKRLSITVNKKKKQKRKKEIAKRLRKIK